MPFLLKLQIRFTFTCNCVDTLDIRGAVLLTTKPGLEDQLRREVIHL